MVKRIIIKWSIASYIICMLLSCERDDLCAEDTLTTPKLIIKFIDRITGSDAKSPNELSIKPIGINDSLLFANNVDSISIPLRTNTAITEFVFTIEEDTIVDRMMPNKDTLSFQYTVEQEYVSSACGFRVSYEGLTVTPPNADTDMNTWINEIIIENQNVIDEQNIHVFILF